MGTDGLHAADRNDPSSLPTRRPKNSRQWGISRTSAGAVQPRFLIISTSTILAAVSSSILRTICSSSMNAFSRTAVAGSKFRACRLAGGFPRRRGFVHVWRLAHFTVAHSLAVVRWPIRCFPIGHGPLKCSRCRMVAAQLHEEGSRSRARASRGVVGPGSSLRAAWPRHGLALRAGAIVSSLSSLWRAHAGMGDRRQTELSQSPPHASKTCSRMRSGTHRCGRIPRCDGNRLGRTDRRRMITYWATADEQRTSI